MKFDVKPRDSGLIKNTLQERMSKLVGEGCTTHLPTLFVKGALFLTKFQNSLFKKKRKFTPKKDII